MIEWGISAFSHDGAITVLKDNDILFASHTERFSKIKNDANLNDEIIKYCLQYGEPDKIYFYENPYIKKFRQLFAGQFLDFFSNLPKNNLKKYNLNNKINYINHHHSHAAGSYFTSNFNEAIIICIDSIGEFESFTIWKGKGTELEKVFSLGYPDSIGLWYSSMTDRIGLKSQEHEYILMGMAALGDYKKYKNLIIEDFFNKLPDENNPTFSFKVDLHKGCKLWRKNLNTEQDKYDIAAAVQSIYEDMFVNILKYAKKITNTNNLVLSGGVSLNCVANTLAFKYFKNVWIMPNPGDAGSSLGCILAKKKQFIKFKSAFLGYDIKGKYPIDDIIFQLKTEKITAVASGKAEFGPRALGHRSILADPRGKDVKDRVNKIKFREPFRPFAPVILQKNVDKYFEVPENFCSPYMQFTVKCKYPNDFPSIVHYDNTSRVQTVTKEDNENLYNLLNKYEIETGCPILLNTSLNIKGQPLINDEEDAKIWQNKYGLKVCLSV